MIYKYFKIMLQVFGDFVFFLQMVNFGTAVWINEAPALTYDGNMGTSEIILAASASPSDRMTSGDQRDTLLTSHRGYMMWGCPKDTLRPQFSPNLVPIFTQKKIMNH